MLGGNLCMRRDRTGLDRSILAEELRKWEVERIQHFTQVISQAVVGVV